APLGLAVVLDRRDGIRNECRRLPHRQFDLPHGEYGSVVCGLAADDRMPLAERVRCRPLRPAPGARRIGRLDLGAKGCAEHFVLAARDADIRELRTLSDLAPPRRRNCSRRAWPHGKTNDRDPPVRTVIVRFLAARSMARRFPNRIFIARALPSDDA